MKVRIQWLDAFNCTRITWKTNGLVIQWFAWKTILNWIWTDDKYRFTFLTK